VDGRLRGHDGSEVQLFGKAAGRDWDPIHANADIDVFVGCDVGR